MRKSKPIKLVSFKACVVEIETYLSNGQKLYHAVLDSLKGQPKRQAQFFGFEDVFKVGDVHEVTFSAKLMRAKGKIKVQNEAEVKAEHDAAVKDALEKLEASQTVN